MSPQEGLFFADTSLENVMVGTNTSTSKAKFTAYAGGNSTGSFALMVTTALVARDPQPYIVAYTTYGAMAVSTTSLPVLSSCGTSPAVRGGQYSFTITPGGTAGGCTATFATPFKNQPHCTAVEQNMSLVNTFSYTYTNTKIVLTQTSFTSPTDVDCHAEGE